MYWWYIVYHLVVDLSVLVLGIVVVAAENEWPVVLDLDVADSLALFVYFLLDFIENYADFFIELFFSQVEFEILGADYVEFFQ